MCWVNKVILTLILFIFLGVSSGCANVLPKRAEIEDITIIKVVGVDKTEKGYRLTTVERSTTKDGGGAGGGQQGGPEAVEPKIMMAEGRTIVESIKNLTTHSHKDVFLGRTEQIIFGVEAARDNIRKVVDYFIRDHELRLDANVYIAPHSTAEDLINGAVADQMFLGDTLRELTLNHGEASMAADVKLVDLAGRLDSETAVPYIPCLLLPQNIHKQADKPLNPAVQLVGVGVFKEGSFQYYLDGTETMAFNLITGDFVSGVIIVKDMTGQDVSLEITKTSRRIRTSINNAIVSVDLEIKAASAIDEQQSAENIYDEQSINYLEWQQEKEIRDMVLNVIKKAQSINTDVFGFGETIYRQHPGKWRQIEDRWNEVFPAMSVNVNVQSVIKRTYIIREPNEYPKKEEK